MYNCKPKTSNARTSSKKEIERVHTSFLPFALRTTNLVSKITVVLVGRDLRVRVRIRVRVSIFIFPDYLNFSTTIIIINWHKH